MSLRVGDLELGIHVFAAGTLPPPDLPDPTPLQEGDPVPAWLPPGLAAVRLAQGLAAVDEAGQPQVGWWRPSTPVIVGWRDEDGPPPQPEAVELPSGAGIGCPGADGWDVLLIGRPDARRWMVGGRRSREELIRVAESLP